jgi:hypothetical protein
MTVPLSLQSNVALAALTPTAYYRRMTRQKSYELKPTLGIKVGLTALCVIVGTLLAFYFLR